MKKITKILVLVLVVVMSMSMLVACAPKTIEDAKTKMEDAGYLVVVVGNVLSAVDLGESNAVAATFFEDKKALKEAFDKAEEVQSEAIKALEDELKDLKDAGVDADLIKAAEDVIKEAKSNKQIIKKSGNWLLVGTEQGVKDFM